MHEFKYSKVWRKSKVQMRHKGVLFVKPKVFVNNNQTKPSDKHNNNNIKLFQLLQLHPATAKGAEEEVEN